MPRKRKRVRKPILENPAEIKIEDFISPNIEWAKKK